MYKINDGRKKVYVVLGMHHSATSFMSKSLIDEGVHMGDGFNGSIALYEDLSFVQFNEMVLAKAGGSWDDVPDMALIENTFEQLKDQARAILAPNLHKEMWGWKDPRSSLTAHLWIRLLKEIDPELDIYLICMFRDPSKVAKSLNDNNYAKMLQLIKVYNESIVNIIKEFTNA